MAREKKNRLDIVGKSLRIKTGAVPCYCGRAEYLTNI